MIKVNIEVNSKHWYRKIRNPQKHFNKKFKTVCKIVNFFNKKNITFTILLTNSLAMKELNKKFRKRNKPTDVLSFPTYVLNDLKKIKEKKIYIGDIAISYEIINHRSKKSNFILEFDKVWIHGILHLIGYNHIKNKDYFKMNRIEKRIIDSI
jgi:probable rRNA maturation factor